MNTSIVEAGGQVARDDVLHRGAGFGRELLFGLIPLPWIWNVATVVLVALIFWWLLRGSQKSVETPMNTLKRRYAAGEIDRKTFLEMKEDLAD
jgi:uncharacterized membrane protein